ncbi:MAG: hypothetical protein HFH47_03305 [Bacilli bacterium]|nr:hypothetical protein [Bacilli bacterium]
MARKKMTKSAKRRLTVITPIVILAIGYCAFTLVSTAISLYQLNIEEASLKAELNDLKGASKELKTEINKLQDKDYVARYARENYLYTKDGEYVIKVDTEEEKKKDSKFELKEDYIIGGCILLGTLVLFYIILKARKSKQKKKKNVKVVSKRK